MTWTRPPRLWECFGVELEYMIVRRDSLDVMPVADEVIRAAAGGYANEVALGPVSWSNELVLHVIELKTTEPVPGLDGVATSFHENVARINGILEPLGGRLMPSAMHPWMDPYRETRLWPHDNREIYGAFDLIFNCQGHGWSNLQSVHLNLPFADDAEFARLHAAARVLLPILPALAASSPIMDSRSTGLLDKRLDVYRTNCAKIPSVTGRVIPEPVFSIRDYEHNILNRMYSDIALHDPEGILQYEWLNARGAIARFERNTIEIRVLDVQECPRADLAVLEAIIQALTALTEERWTPLVEQQAWAAEDLEAIFLATVADAESAIIANTSYLNLFGLREGKACSAGELWAYLVDELVDDVDAKAALEHILRHGTLARRILRAVNGDTSRARLAEVYGALCGCLDQGRMFL